MGLPHTYTDSGREGAGFSGERADCTVRALAACLGIPYAEAHARLKAQGRKDRCRFTFRLHSEALGFELVPELSGKRLSHVLAEIPSGRFLVRVSKHIFAVVD